MYLCICIYVLFLPSPTWSYLITGFWAGYGGAWRGSYRAGVFCIVPLTRLVPRRGQLY